MVAAVFCTACDAVSGRAQRATLVIDACVSELDSIPLLLPFVLNLSSHIFQQRVEHQRTQWISLLCSTLQIEQFADPICPDSGLLASIQSLHDCHIRFGDILSAKGVPKTLVFDAVESFLEVDCSSPDRNLPLMTLLEDLCECKHMVNCAVVRPETSLVR